MSDFTNLFPSLYPSESSNSDLVNNRTTTTAANIEIEEEVHLASSNPKKRAGRKKFQETRHPVFRGIRQRNTGKWVCEVREPNKTTRIWLGTFPTIEMAARAHDVAALALRGRSACLNFADSAWRLRIPTSTDPKEIQRAAAEAAEEFRPSRVTEDVMNFPTNENVGDDDSVLGGGEQVGFCADMAEGPMLSPPRYSTEGCYFNDNEVDFYHDLTLWNY
ncbi:dehydration-responsive element-binding protein 1E-like [Impatiens glandulifera]|uniref:dehydration-responsive element-binding protein 1E-like n=1 Tax=Impatiens glandulifera TaxID=253017 RepID=UPI001FB0E2D9|nr:dehydration-responsive element-binding protein 1E-like [Impatiens glandulifera]